VREPVELLFSSHAGYHYGYVIQGIVR